MPDPIFSLPFDEAIKFLREKLSLPTETWTDIWQEMHDQAFVVAGATKADLISDLRAAVDQAIADGTTIETFRAAFDAAVERHGWSYVGGRNWRTRVIYETNVTQAYNAGRHRQMSDPAMLARRPYWEYRHGDSAHPRPQHQAWDGLVIRADDPWWQTHSPANGWGCKCKKFALSDRDLERLGKNGPDPAPGGATYEWTNKRTGETHQVPVGIDPGFAYTPGASRMSWQPDLAKYPPALRGHLERHIDENTNGRADQ
ncbi:MAG: phage minor head protein [Pseudomonadota bacterium]